MDACMHASVIIVVYMMIYIPVYIGMYIGLCLSSIIVSGYNRLCFHAKCSWFLLYQVRIVFTGCAYLRTVSRAAIFFLFLFFICIVSLCSIFFFFSSWREMERDICVKEKAVEETMAWYLPVGRRRRRIYPLSVFFFFFRLLGATPSIFYFIGLWYYCSRRC